MLCKQLIEITPHFITVDQAVLKHPQDLGDFCGFYHRDQIVHFSEVAIEVVVNNLDILEPKVDT